MGLSKGGLVIKRENKDLTHDDEDKNNADDD